MKNVILGLMAGLFAGPASAGEALQVKQEEYGDKWPFTVEEGQLGCQQGIAPYFQTKGGNKYALTGFGKTLKLKPVNAIWRDNPAIPGTKVNLGDMIQLAQQQCG